ncbi:MAG: polysaccharide deacetylase family protein [Lachnospiraceae bacterium]|nr:polysaccharide deacetylase family protein [Lachnospiraceae bacterium]
MKKYIEKVKQLIRIFPPRQEGQSGEEYAKQRVVLGIKYGVFALAAFAVLRGVLVVAGQSITVSNSVDGRELPIYCVETQEKKIALSFDAAWGNEDTAKILEILKKHDVHVTFFMTGGWVESYPDDVKAILAAGHDLGNHSENHKNMSQLSDEEKKEELMKVHTKVQELTGYDMFLFRPPYGDYDNAVVNVAKDCGYYTIQWDVDSLDWKDYGVDSIIKTVTQHKHLGNGSIILCHNGAKYTAQALDTLIATLKNEGYTFVPISELIYKDGYHMNHEGRQIKN